jgi:hypothetical protein
MKTRGWLIIVLVLVLIAIYGYLGFGYLNQNRQNSNLLTDISSLKAVLAMAPDIPTGLEERETAARAKLQAAQKLLTAEADYTIILDKVLRLAEEAGIKALPLSTQAWLPEQVTGTTINVFNLSLQATGDFQSLQDFYRSLETSSFDTMVLKYLKVVRETADTGANMTAELDIALYALAPGK